MSNSATTAAKRRRAGAIISPMMQNATPSSPAQAAGPIARARNAPALQKDIAITNSIMNKQQQQQAAAPTAAQAKQLTLAQVINHIDTRLLSLETKVTSVADTIAKYPDPDLIVEQGETEDTVGPSISSEVLENFVKLDEVDTIVQEIFTPHVQEFDHRYQVLASEIAELKQALMKLQTYTLEINKTLFEERIQILSEMGPSQAKNMNDTATANVLSDTVLPDEEPTNEVPIVADQQSLEPTAAVEEPEYEPEPVFDINALISQSM